jgi:hypothetical protein
LFEKLKSFVSEKMFVCRPKEISIKDLTIKECNTSVERRVILFS